MADCRLHAQPGCQHAISLAPRCMECPTATPPIALRRSGARAAVPSTSCTLKFILPAVSLKMRSLRILASNFSASACVSPCSAQTSTSKPGPMAPTVCASTSTRALRTRCSSAIMTESYKRTWLLRLLSTRTPPPSIRRLPSPLLAASPADLSKAPMPTAAPPSPKGRLISSI